MTAGKINCSTESPLDVTTSATLRELLEDCRTIKDSSTRQYGTRTSKVSSIVLKKDQYRKITGLSKE
jgi:hypothetical protein